MSDGGAEETKGGLPPQRKEVAQPASPTCTGQELQANVTDEKSGVAEPLGEEAAESKSNDSLKTEIAGECGDNPSTTLTGSTNRAEELRGERVNPRTPLPADEPRAVRY